MDTNSQTPAASQVKIKFTKPGVDHYECEVHADMDGTIVVLARPAARRPPSPSFTG